MQEDSDGSTSDGKGCHRSDAWKYRDDSKSDGTSPLKYICSRFLLFLGDSYLLLYTCWLGAV
jgi:hypothetical protein